MSERKKRIKEMIENTPADNFVKRRLVECRCAGPGDVSAYFNSTPLPPQGFIIMAAFGANFSDTADDVKFTVGLATKNVQTEYEMNTAGPFFKYFRYHNNRAVEFCLPNFGSFEFTDLSQLVVTPGLRIVAFVEPLVSKPYDVVFSLLVHKLDPTIFDAIAASEPK